MWGTCLAHPEIPWGWLGLCTALRLRAVGCLNVPHVLVAQDRMTRCYAWCVCVQSASLWSPSVCLPLTKWVHNCSIEPFFLFPRTTVWVCPLLSASPLWVCLASPLPLRKSSVCPWVVWLEQRHHCLAHDCSPEWWAGGCDTQALGHNILYMCRSCVLALLSSSKRVSQEMALTEIEEFNTCLAASPFGSPPEGAAETEAGRGSKLPGQRSRG